MKRVLLAFLILGLVVPALQAQTAIDTSNIHVKKAIADTMSPAELQAYKERLARDVANRQPPQRRDNILAPADTCNAATPEISTLPYNPPADTTVGMTDDYDLPADTMAPTCTAPSTCVGGPSGGGNIYTNTGTAPDRAYAIEVDQTCTLSITMDPTGAEDMSVIVYQSQCSSLLSDCVCIDDTGVGGVAETVSLTATAGTQYYIVVDGYGPAPGQAGPFTLNVTETTATGCELIPVELQNFSVN